MTTQNQIFTDVHHLTKVDKFLMDFWGKSTPKDHDNELSLPPLDPCINMTTPHRQRTRRRPNNAGACAQSYSSSNTPYASSAMLHIHIDMSLTRSLAPVGQGHIRSTSIGDNNGLRGGAFWNPDTQVGNGFFVSIRHIHWHNNTSLTKNQKLPTINAGAQVLALISTPL